MRRLVIACIPLLLSVAGCSGDDDRAAPAARTSETTSTTTTEASTASTSVAPTTTTARPTATSIAAGAQDGVALLTAVRVARHDGADRVVFEFRGDQPPGVVVEATSRPVREDGSGDEVAIEGDAVVEIRMSPAAGADLDNGGTPTYTGPRRLRPDGTANIKELVKTGDFEAVVTWAVGLDRAVPGRVTTLRSPARVVVDFSG